MSRKDAKAAKRRFHFACFASLRDFYDSKVSNSSRLLFDTATCILFSMMR